MILRPALSRVVLGALLPLAFFAFSPDLLAAGLTTAEDGASDIVDLFDGIAPYVQYIGVILAFFIFFFSSLSGRAMWSVLALVLVGCWGISNAQSIVDFAGGI